jgi:catechol 2,3-dioxygenase-like lactoylglutathione lyase family enzyme
MSTIETKLEVIVLPVSDVDRSKQFYERLGWRLDADFAAGADWRIVQFTPPGSPCSIHIGKGITSAAPGSVQGLMLIVDDVVAARANLAGRGVDVSEVFHFQGGFNVSSTKGRVSGLDPERQSYRSWLSFRDPDGNGWMVQEIRTRLPGRGFSPDVAAVAEVLREAETRHGDYEPKSPKHHWSEWYAAYIVARERGKSPEEAVAEGARHIEAGQR